MSSIKQFHFRLRTTCLMDNMGHVTTWMIWENPFTSSASFSYISLFFTESLENLLEFPTVCSSTWQTICIVYVNLHVQSSSVLVLFPSLSLPLCCSPSLVLLKLTNKWRIIINFHHFTRTKTKSNESHMTKYFVCALQFKGIQSVNISSFIKFYHLATLSRLNAYCILPFALSLSLSPFRIPTTTN